MFILPVTLSKHDLAIHNFIVPNDVRRREKKGLFHDLLLKSQTFLPPKKKNFRCRFKNGKKKNYSGKLSMTQFVVDHPFALFTHLRVSHHGLKRQTIIQVLQDSFMGFFSAPTFRTQNFDFNQTLNRNCFMGIQSKFPILNFKSW